LGNLSDAGGEALLGCPAVHKLKKLDLHHHYLSEPFVEELQKLPGEVDVDDPCEVEFETYDGRTWTHRYNTVAEGRQRAGGRMAFSEHLQTFAGLTVRWFDPKAKRKPARPCVWRVGGRDYLRFVDSQFNTGDELEFPQLLDLFLDRHGGKDLSALVVG